MSEASLLNIEIVFAVPERYRCIELRLPMASRVGDALDLAALDAQWSEIAAQWDGQSLAVFGRIACRETPLHDFDRIELLRPLVIDPKQARRQRAAGGIKD